MIFYEVGTADNSCYAGLAEPDWHRLYPLNQEILMESLELIGRRGLQQAQPITIKTRENLASISLFIRSI